MSGRLRDWGKLASTETAEEVERYQALLSRRLPIKHSDVIAVTDPWYLIPEQCVTPAGFERSFGWELGTHLPFVFTTLPRRGDGNYMSEVLVRRQALCLFLVVLGLNVMSWAGSPGGASPATTTAAAAASPDPDPNPSPTPAVANSAVFDSLLNLMVNKGVLTSPEAAALRGLPAGQQVTPLLALLAKKGVLSQDEVAALNIAPSASGYSSSLALVPNPGVATIVQTAQSGTAQAPPKPPAAPTVVAAVMPLRVLPVDAPKREGLIPDLKIGPVRVKPYGFIKMGLVHDSSSPRGDDFPLPQFLFGDTGPNPSPEFHIKARATRLGTNLEWMDLSPKITLTGKFEMDFEGNFTATDNRNISSIRSSQMSIRLAYGRVDYAATDKTSVFGLFGQDWTPFGSSTLPNSIETTGLGLGFGSLYERAAQARGGILHNFGGSRTFKWLTEFAAVMPAYGNVPSGSNFQIPGPNAGSNVFNVVAPTGGLVVGGVTIPAGTVIGTTTIPQTANTGLGLSNQLSFGERQGADSGKPEVEARMTWQFQLDKAPGVAPAQLIVSGVESKRDAIVVSTNVPTAFKAAFPRGVRVDSERYGINFQAQLPTRFATFLASYYRGADLRFFFAGQLFSNYNNTAGLTGTSTAPSIDGSAAVVFGNLGGVATVAPQNPVRTVGGFVEVGLPLSRWFNVKPSSRAAGWSANLHFAKDAVVATDLYKVVPAGGRAKSYWAFGNLQYKMNSFVTFAYEEGLYWTVAVPSPAGVFPLWQGFPTREAKNLRSEFATIFTF